MRYDSTFLLFLLSLGIMFYAFLRVKHLPKKPIKTIKKWWKKLTFTAINNAKLLAAPLFFTGIFIRFRPLMDLAIYLFFWATMTTLTFVLLEMRQVKEESLKNEALIPLATDLLAAQEIYTFFQKKKKS